MINFIFSSHLPELGFLSFFYMTATCWLTTNPKMAFRGLLFVVAFWASTVCSTKAGLPDNPEWGSPVAQARRMGCQSKEDCPENHFCEGRGQFKRCTECIDCSRFQRQPKKKSYDGESCATHHTECGECNTGYDETGGVCIPKATSTLSPPTLLGFGQDESFKNEKAPDSIEASVPWLVTVIMICVIMVVVVVLSIGIHFYNKVYQRNRTGYEEEAGLTSCGYNGPYEHAATAPPPDEYNSQPTPYNPAFTNNMRRERKLILPRKQTEMTSKALPFDAGNGAGTWYYTNDEAGDLPDAVDGAAASSPSDPQQSTGGDSTNDNAASNHVANGPNLGSGRVPQGNLLVQGEMNSLVPDSNPGGRENRLSVQGADRSAQSVPPQGQGQSDPNNPVVFALQIGARIMILNSQPPPNNPSGGNPSQVPRMVTSAPTSPRLIDDTHAVNLTGLSGTFQSNASLDSGTGTNEHDRSVPSHSGSGVFSDLDESGMYDEVDSNVHHAQVQQVPDLEIDDAYLMEDQD